MCLPVKAPRTEFAPHSSRLSDCFGESARTVLSKGNYRIVAMGSPVTSLDFESDSVRCPSANPEIRRAPGTEPEVAARDRTYRKAAVASDYSFFRRNVQLDQPKDSSAQVFSWRSALRIRTLHSCSPVRSTRLLQSRVQLETRRLAEIPELTSTEYRERRTIPCTAVEEFEHRPAARQSYSPHRRTLGGIFPADTLTNRDRMNELPFRRHSGFRPVILLNRLSGSNTGFVSNASSRNKPHLSLLLYPLIERW